MPYFNFRAINEQRKNEQTDILAAELRRLNSLDCSSGLPNAFSLAYAMKMEISPHLPVAKSAISAPSILAQIYCASTLTTKRAQINKYNSFCCFSKVPTVKGKISFDSLSRFSLHLNECEFALGAIVGYVGNFLDPFFLILLRPKIIDTSLK